MPKINPFTVPVIVARIKNLATGKIVVVEGVDDIIVYRSLITIFASKRIQVLTAGGRDKVLEVFDEVKKLGYLDKAIFIVDQDSWIFLEFLPHIKIPVSFILLAIRLKTTFM
ncbi:DUF4435 domain-containing protein [Acinetobacter soli]|nr:DUF4435 domain-containing protein [Acinetobacter soli]